MLLLYAYFGGIICILLVAGAAVKQGFAEKDVGPGIILTIALIWPFIFTYLMFKNID